MNKNRGKLISIMLLLLSAVGLCVCAIQFAMAVRFMKLPKALLYFLLTSLCVETVVFSVIHLVKKRK